MAKIFSDGTGQIIGFYRFPYELGNTAPVGTIFTVDFDPSTNPALLQDLNSVITFYTMPNGVLTKNALPVVINPPSAVYSEESTLFQVLSVLSAAQYQNATVTLSQANQAFNRIQAGTATLVDIQVYLVFLSRGLGRIFTRVLTT